MRKILLIVILLLSLPLVFQAQSPFLHNLTEEVENIVKPQSPIQAPAIPEAGILDVPPSS